MRSIPFRIVDIKVDKFSITSSQFLPEERVEVRTGYEFGVNVEKHIVQSRVVYNYLQNDNNLLNLVLTCSFDVKPEEFNILLHDETFVIEPFFSQYLATINVGAARGEIHARCELMGSPLVNVILPPINLTAARNKPIEIKLNS